MVEPAVRLTAQFQEHLLTTIGTFLLASFVASYVIPKALSLLSRTANATLERWGVRDIAAELWKHAPPGVSFLSLVYSAQAAVVTFAALYVLSVWGMGGFVVSAIQLLLASLPDFARLLLTALILAIMYSGSHYIGEWVGGLGAEGRYVEEHTQEILSRSFQFVFLLGGALTILSIWKVDVNSFLLGAGVLSVLVGFAARSTFSSVISGFVLMFSRPFEVGDWVQISDEEGQVTDMTIVNTRLRTTDAERVIVPNDLVGESEIVNLSDENNLCVSLEVGVAYDTDLDRAIEVIEEAATGLEPLAGGSGVEVYPSRFGDSAVVLEVRFWIDHPNPHRRRRARGDVVTAIKTAFDREGIEIPFPQRDLHVPADRSEPTRAAVEPGERDETA